MTNQSTTKTAEGRVRSPEARMAAPTRQQASSHVHESPAAGAHAAEHLTNEDSTPGAGALPSAAHRAGKEVDGAAG